MPLNGKGCVSTKERTDSKLPNYKPSSKMLMNEPTFKPEVKLQAMDVHCALYIHRIFRLPRWVPSTNIMADVFSLIRFFVRFGILRMSSNN